MCLVPVTVPGETNLKTTTLYIQEGIISAPHVAASHSNVSTSTKTHMHTDPQRVMDRSPCAPLSECNKAFHACSLHLFGLWSVKPVPTNKAFQTEHPLAALINIIFMFIATD